MVRTMNISRGLSVAALALVLGIAGCSKVVTQENFDRIQSGQSEADVENVLGKPSTTVTEHGAMGDVVTRTWKDGNKTITVHFIGDKVIEADKSGF